VRKAEVPTPQDHDPVRAFKARCRAGGTLSLRRDRESNPEGSSRRSAVFGTVAVASRLASP